MVNAIEDFSYVLICHVYNILVKCFFMYFAHFVIGYFILFYFILFVNFESCLCISDTIPLLIPFSSGTQSCPTLCDPMNRSTPGLPVQYQLPEFTQTDVHRVSDAIKPSHPLSPPSPPDPNPSQHQGLFQWVNSSHEVAKVLEFQLQHQSYQYTARTDLL